MDFFRTTPPPESPSSLADEVLSCAPTLRAQLILLSVSGLLWYFALPWIAQRVIRPYAEAAPWRDRWSGFWTSWFQKSLQLHGLPAEQYFDQACVFTAILLQHFVGGLLCVPSVVGAPLALAAPLARLGALCEAGWEFQDVVTMIYQRLFGGEAGLKRFPNVVVVAQLVHHAMGLSMVVPMNLALGDDRAYHEFVFLLQGAAFIALATQGYGFTLDVKTRGGLRTMKLISAFTVLVLLYSRGVRYVVVAAQLLRAIDGPLWYVGANAVGLMGLLNLAMTGDAAAKFVKFARTSHNDAGVVELHRQLSGSLSPHSPRTGGGNWKKEH